MESKRSKSDFVSLREQIPLASLHAWMVFVRQMHQLVVGTPVDEIPTVLVVAAAKHAKLDVVSFSQTDFDERS